MNQVVVQLTKLISDSSLTELFQNTYESTIGEIRKDFTSIQKQADEEIAKFTNEIKRYPRLSKNDLYSYADRYHIPHSKAESIAKKYIKLI